MKSTKSLAVLTLISFFAIAHSLSGTTIPAGTILTIRMVAAVSSQEQPGRTFAGQLDQAVVIQGKTLLGAGARVVCVVETSRGKPSTRDSLRVNITSISQNGKNVPLQTTGGVYPTVRTKNVKQARAGVSVNEGTIPAGTKLQFQLSEPLTI